MLRRQPVGDGGRAAWIGHGVDLVEALLVAEADAFVLAQVFIPGADDELLEHAPGIGCVSPHPPAHRARAASGVAPGVERVEELLLAPGPRPVLDRNQHRPVGAPARRRVAGPASRRQAGDRCGRSP